MLLLIDPCGHGRCLYDEAIDLTALGVLSIERISRVEPDNAGRWWAHLVNGPKLGPFARRSQALNAERTYLEANCFDIRPM